MAHAQRRASVPAMDHTPAEATERRRQGWRLQVALLVSLVLHMLLAGGLATTGLGILPVPSADDAPSRNIFRPKVAADFPIEVPKSPAEEAAHQKPLDAKLPEGGAAKAAQKAAAARAVSPTKSGESPEEVRVAAKLPERQRAADVGRPDPARQLERLASDASREEKPQADAIAAIGQLNPSAAPRPAAAPRTQRSEPSQRATPSAALKPREVPLVPDAAPRPKTPTQAREREPVSAPRADSLDRRQTPAEPAPMTPRAESIAAAPGTAEAGGNPQVRPANEAVPRRRAADARQSRVAEDATASPAAVDEPAVAAAAATPVVGGTGGQRAASAALSLPTGGSASLERSQVAMAAGDGGVAAPIPLPAGGGAKAGADAAAPSSGPTAVAAAPRAAGRGRGEAGRATSGAVRAGAALGGTDEGDTDSGATGSAAAAVGSAAVAGRGGSRASTGAGGPPATQAAGGSPGRAALGQAAAEADAGRVDSLADARSGAGGQTPAGSGMAEKGGAVGGSPGPAPRAVARIARGSSAGGPAAVSRGGGEELMPRTRAGDPDGEDGDGLSVEVGPEALAALGAAVGGGGRRNASGSGGQALTVAALPRATAVVLPVEGRVREIAAPFAKRARTNRTAERTDSMVDRGLEFLGRAQQADGRWSLGVYPGSKDEPAPKLASDTAATGLALLSFLGAGYDHFEGKHRDTVRRGLEFLLTAQKDDGDLYLPADPLSNSCSWLYSHGIATMALCEAVGMTGDAIIRPSAERACRFITASQHPDRGGWRYTPRSDADLSVSGWMLVALRSGQLAKVPVETRTLDGVRSLLEASTIGASTPAARSPLTRFHYNAIKPDQRPSEMSTACMNAVGTLMRLHTGWKKTDPQVIENGRTLATLRPTYGTASQKLRDCYLWYYISQVLVHTGGSDWDEWYQGLEEVLAARQVADGPLGGSWDPLGPTPDRWGQYGGRLYVTTLHLLTLEVPYRHLPTYSAGQ